MTFRKNCAFTSIWVSPGKLAHKEIQSWLKLKNRILKKNARVLIPAAPATATVKNVRNTISAPVPKQVAANKMMNQELKFPVTWHYKIITEKSMPTAKNEIEKVLAANGITDKLEAGNESSAGKYLSYKISVTFQDRETMQRVSCELSAAPGVKFLI
jgi:putative lipoic acid-binding regulatory protein